MTTMPTGPAPSLEELLLRVEQMRRGGGGGIAQMFKSAPGPFDAQPVDVLKMVSAMAADPYSPVNLDGSRPTPAPILQRPAPAPIRPVALPPSQTQAQQIISRMAPTMASPSPYAFGQHSQPSPGLASLFANPNSAMYKPAPPAPPAGGPVAGGAPTGIDEGWRRILSIEGGLNGDGSFRVNAQSGAVGPAQMLPSTGPEAARIAGLPWDEKRFRSDRAYNEALGKAYYNMLVQRYGGNLSTAALAYHSGMGNVDKGNIGPAGQEYLSMFNAGGRGGGTIGSAAMGIAGQPGLVNGFDPTYYNQALSQVDQAMGEALKPQTFDVAMPDRPEVPELVKPPALDFTKQDEWLAKLKPQGDSKATQSAISRRGMFEGLAQGLANTPEDAHWGKVLANVGAGMLAGRVSGEREVQARIDKFDEKMDQWEALNFANEKEKAGLVFNAALKEVDAINQRNILVFNNNLDDWKQKNNFVIQNGQFIKSTQTENGVQVTTTPIRSIIAPQMMLQKAQIMSNMAGSANQASQAQAQITNSIIGQVAGQEYLNGKSNDPANMGMEQQVGSIANAVISSNAGARVFGDEGWSAIQSEAKKAAIAAGLTPGTQEYVDFTTEDITTSVIGNFLQTPALVERAMEMGPLLSATEAARRQRNTTESTSTKRGRVTERQTVRY